jgi:hypothetical protein
VSDLQPLVLQPLLHDIPGQRRADVETLRHVTFLPLQL